MAITQDFIDEQEQPDYAKIEDPVEALKRQNRLDAKLAKAQDNLKFKPVTGPRTIRYLEGLKAKEKVKALASDIEQKKLDKIEGYRNALSLQNAAKPTPDLATQFNKGYTPELATSAFTRTGYRPLKEDEETP